MPLRTDIPNNKFRLMICIDVDSMINDYVVIFFPPRKTDRPSAGGGGV